MNRHLSLLVAFGLMISGIVKMIAQALQQETLLIPTCLGQTLTLQVDQSGWNALHCWGCYAFVAGLAMLTAVTVMNIRSKGASA